MWKEQDIQAQRLTEGMVTQQDSGGLTGIVGVFRQNHQRNPLPYHGPHVPLRSGQAQKPPIKR